MFGHILSRLSTAVTTATVAEPIGQKWSAVLVQSVRHRKIIKRCGYLEIPEFKKRDLRYKTSTGLRPKLMSWQDYQVRKWKAQHWNKRFHEWHIRMDYAESLLRTGLSAKTVHKLVDIHPHCIEYIERKLSGNIELLREAEYSNFVNHTPGSY